MSGKRYAHAIAPHPEEGQATPLRELVRYHYAHATAWHLAFSEVIDDPGPRLDLALSQYMSHIHSAFLYDALAQGLSGQDAADWASTRSHGESAEWIYERAEVYDLDPDEVLPYRIRKLEAKS